jgi:hypothetical protein
VDKTKGKELLMTKTGIGAEIWGKIENPWEVYYGGCSEDRARGEKIYISFTARGGERRVGDRIYNNCELGAVRAYVTLVYLTNELSRVSPDDTYATGGIFSGPDVNNKSKDNLEKRRVNVEFTLKAAKVDDVSP